MGVRTTPRTGGRVWLSMHKQQKMRRPPRGVSRKNTGVSVVSTTSDDWPLPPLVPQELVFTAEDTKKKPRRILPWKHRQLTAAALNLSESELEAKRLLDAPKYRCANLLPCSFKRMRESFQRDGVVDAKWAGKARSWITSNRKKRNQATLFYDEIWNNLFVVAKHVKTKFGDSDDAWARYRGYAHSMATVIEPLLIGNRDGLTHHDYGTPFSSAGVGCVDAAWKGENPYT